MCIGCRSAALSTAVGHTLNALSWSPSWKASGFSTRAESRIAGQPEELRAVSVGLRSPACCTSTRPRARSATAAAPRAARSRAAIPAPTSDCWPRSTRWTARCPVRPRTSCAPAPSISSATVASNGWPPSPTGTCTTCGRRQATINDAAGRYQPDAAGTSRHRRTPPPAALRTTRLDTGRYRASRRPGQQLAGFPPNTNSGRARPRRRSPVGFRVSWLG